MAHGVLLTLKYGAVVSGTNEITGAEIDAPTPLVALILAWYVWPATITSTPGLYSFDSVPTTLVSRTMVWDGRLEHGSTSFVPTQMW